MYNNLISEDIIQNKSWPGALYMDKYCTGAAEGTVNKILCLCK